MTSAAERLAKGERARKIAALIGKRGLTRAAAADVLEIDRRRRRAWAVTGSPAFASIGCAVRRPARK